MWKDGLFKLFGDRNIKFYEFADLSKLNSMKICAKALVLVEPEDTLQLLFVLRVARSFDVAVRVVGGMTNTLVSDGVFDGILIRTARIDSVEFTENNEVYAECGALLGTIVHGAEKRGIAGFAELVGIPGTMGGALYGNAGAHLRSISELVLSVCVYDVIENSKKILSVDDIVYGYRDSIFKREDRYVILSAHLRGFSTEKNDLKTKMAEYIEIRQRRQPLSLPSLGSVFKHPEGDFAPRLIESLGLKGFQVGNAEVSEIHAGFIVNKGGATASDVKELIKIIKKMVDDAYGINLEEEINYLE